MPPSLTSKFLVQSSNAECGGLETAHKNSRHMFQYSNRMFKQSLANFIQDLFWRVRFSNEDFKTVEHLGGSWRSSRFELECTWIKILLEAWDVRREAKRFVSVSSLNELKEKIRAHAFFEGFT